MNRYLSTVSVLALLGLGGWSAASLAQEQDPNLVQEEVQGEVPAEGEVATDETVVLPAEGEQAEEIVIEEQPADDAATGMEALGDAAAGFAGEEEPPADDATVADDQQMLPATEDGTEMAQPVEGEMPEAPAEDQMAAPEGEQMLPATEDGAEMATPAEGEMLEMPTEEQMAEPAEGEQMMPAAEDDAEMAAPAEGEMLEQMPAEDQAVAPEDAEQLMPAPEDEMAAPDGELLPETPADAYAVLPDPDTPPLNPGEVTVTIQNASAAPLDVFVEPEGGGDPVLVMSLDPGYEAVQPTPVGRNWWLAQDDQWIQGFTPTEEPEQVLRYVGVTQ